MPLVSLSFILSVVLLLFALMILKIIIIPYLKINSYKGKKGVETYFFPILGTYHRLMSDLKNKGDALATVKESSKNFPDTQYLVTNLGSSIVYGIRRPSHLKEFIQKQDLYKKASFLKVLSILGNGLVTAEGETWKRHRRIISSIFNYEFLKMNTKTVQDTAREFLNKISPEEYDSYSVLNRIQDITGEVVGRIFFGEHLNNYSYEGKPLTRTLEGIMSDLSVCSRTPLVLFFGPRVLNIPVIPKYKKLMDKVRGFREVCFKIIQDRKSQEQQNYDLLGLLLETQKAQDPEQRFSDDEIIDEFITFFIAGMDTTGHLITMTLYNLDKYSKFQEELEQERKQTYNKESVITTDTLQSMDLLHSILKETLRFYCPLPGGPPREALVDHDLLDIKIKKGDLLKFELFSMFFNEAYFENPWEFNPSRWKTEPKLDTYAFLPFSGGARNCLGQHMAIMEAKIIVSEFLEKFNFKVHDGYKLRMVFKLTYEPADELLFSLTPRK